MPVSGFFSGDKDERIITGIASDFASLQEDFVKVYQSENHRILSARENKFKAKLSRLYDAASKLDGTETCVDKKTGKEINLKQHILSFIYVLSVDQTLVPKDVAKKTENDLATLPVPVLNHYNNYLAVCSGAASFGTKKKHYKLNPELAQALTRLLDDVSANGANTGEYLFSFTKKEDYSVFMKEMLPVFSKQFTFAIPKEEEKYYLLKGYMFSTGAPDENWDGKIAWTDAKGAIHQVQVTQRLAGRLKKDGDSVLVGEYRNGKKMGEYRIQLQGGQLNICLKESEEYVLRILPGKASITPVAQKEGKGAQKTGPINNIFTMEIEKPDKGNAFVFENRACGVKIKIPVVFEKVEERVKRQDKFAKYSGGDGRINLRKIPPSNYMKQPLTCPASGGKGGF